MTGLLSTKNLLVSLLILCVIFDITSACSSRRRRRHRYYGKRSIESLDSPVSRELIERQRRSADETIIDPLIKNQKKSDRITNSLPRFDTSCQKVLCSSSPKYPKVSMAKVVAESREILRSGVPSEIFSNRRMNLKSFKTKILDTNTPLTAAGKCAKGLKLTYPKEGYNRRHRQFFYIVNISNFRQGVCTRECPSDNSVLADSSYYQAYTEEKLVVLPIDKRDFTIQDLKIRKILIPHGCPQRVF